MTTDLDQRQVDLRERAQRRMKEVRDFWGHFWFFAVVMTIFVVVDLVDGSDGGDRFIGLDWAYFPLIGWGAFVLAHFLSLFVFNRRFTENWEERKVQEYMRREQSDSDAQDFSLR